MVDFFKKTKLDLGVIQENSKVKFVVGFNKGDKDRIVNTKTGCGSCTTVDKIDDEGVHVTFSPGNIPLHLNTDKWDVEKNLRCFLDENSFILVSFKATVVKK